MLMLRPLLLSLLFSLLASAVPAASEAQDPAVLARLQRHGRMDESTARRTVRRVNEFMAENAARGGEEYDDLRQATNRALFGPSAGPGRTRADFDQRLSAVIDRLSTGLNLPTLQAFFPARRNGAVLCAAEFGLTMPECDALISAATNQTSALPYFAPDDGRELTLTLTRERVRRRLAAQITERLLATMLGVPRVLTNDQRGRGLVRLLEACPGGNTDRESQIRAWHVGPNPGMARCIAERLARQGTDSGIQGAIFVLGMSERAAAAYIRWGAPQAAAAPPAPPAVQPPRQQVRPPVAPQRPPQVQTPPPNAYRAPVPQPRAQGPGVQQRRAAPPRATAAANPNAAETLRQQGRGHFGVGRFAQAAAAYEASTTLDPNNAGGWAGLGASRAQMNDQQGASLAYEQAVRLAPENASYLVALGRAFAGAGNNAGAIAALQQALRVEPQNATAIEGLRALGGERPAPPLPEAPERNAIIAVMQPLRGALQGCAPSFTGQVTFQLKIQGETGDVVEASYSGENVPEEEGACMTSVVQSARFPRFTRETLDIGYPYVLGD